MRSTLRYLAILGALAWLGVIAPGHQRGIVTVPGPTNSTHCTNTNNDTTTLNTSHCHNTPTNTPASTPANNQSHTPDDPAKDCAVCVIIATLDTPLPLIFISQPTALIDIYKQRTPQSVTPSNHTAILGSRAPPQLA